uniref:Uncharacterized protein n=1 Tax=Moniliophthora roreri TaxID=221103 RepID=A0A0W0FH55_MONRR
MQNVLDGISRFNVNPSVMVEGSGRG